MTSRRLISAVGSLLAKKGFKGIGVNAVAREAGVDKVLIYRYFGGLEGLIAAFGKEGDFWPSALELAGGDLQKFSQMPLDERLSVFASNFIDALRKRPLTQAIMAWEIIEPNGLTEELERIRERSIIEFFQMFFVKDQIKIDLQAIIMLIGAAISYLVLRSKNIDLFGGLDLGSEQGWKRIEKAIEPITRGVLNNK
ncbi:MAG: TetR/AcrR family transcriptional regulator [Deltaproteobacteria bacterium]|nr:TetR/AcrR family transcriptional regulator [Deltaproteobacteria bacterium]